MNDERIQIRNNVDISNFPLKISFFVNGEVYFIGKVYDLSKHGVCAMVDNSIKEFDTGISGLIKIWKVEKYVQFPAICKWKKSLHTINFCGFETVENLYHTDLKNYMQQ